jgi:hypothetical protein
MTLGMTRRERVQATLDHQPVDRCALLEQLSYNPRVIADWTGKKIDGFNYTLDDICQVIGQTCDLVMPPVVPRGTARETTADGFVVQKDNWTTWHVSRPFTDEHGACDWLRQRTASIRSGLFGADTARADYRQSMLDLQSRIGDTVILNYSATGFCGSFDQMGLEIFTFFQLEYPEVFKEYMETSVARELRRIHAVADPELSPVILIPEDFATRQGPIFSPEFLHDYHYLYVTELADAWHEHDVKVLYHSDGNWKRVIPDLKACHVDGFYCLEPNCGMDVVELKKAWPEMVWAGGVDGVDLMERGTPEQVRAEVQRQIHATDALDTGGMFVASSSEINPPIPPENFRAMVEIVQQTHRKPEAAAVRPRFVLEGHEDEVYHEQRVPGRETEPEYCAVLDQSWTFNRAMRWADTLNATVLPYEVGGSLALTGEARISDWFSDPINSLRHAGADLTLKKQSGRQREVVVLPGLQINLDQHPTLKVSVSAASASWQVCVLVKGRSGAPLVASDWQDGCGTVDLDLAQAWRSRGYSQRFAELHVAVGVWTEAPATPASMTFAAQLPGHAALVACLPVVRRVGSPVPISAVVVDADGTHPDVQVTIRVNGQTTCLQAKGDLWSTTLEGLPEGEHLAELETTGDTRLTNSLVLCVTDGHFLQYASAAHSLMRNGRPLGPFSGSYQGMVFARNIGTPQEALVQGQAEWSAWHEAEPDAEHWHYWEALTEAELETRFAYLENCGWDLLHLCQGWGLWEKLDACGHIAPHGAEQVGLVLRVAARHGMALLQALSHYPYGNGQTPVLRQYLEAGYQDGDWTHPDADTRFTELFHGYLHDYADLFRDETALFAMSTSGEGDIAAGPDRVNDTYRFMRTHMPNHIFLCEPIFQLFDLPDEHRRQWHLQGGAQKRAEGCRTDVAWEPQLAGSRLYWMGRELHPEIDLAVEFKFLQLGDYFMGEGSWPCPHLYRRFMGYRDSWAGTERYRRRVRDSLYLGLVHRNPVMLTWEEQYAEDERSILQQVRRRIDWSQPFQPAPVGIRVESSNVGGGPWGSEGRHTLGQYEEYFSALPLMTRYLGPDETPDPGLMVLAATSPFAAPDLPAELLASGPLCLSSGYRASYLWSADRQSLIAYVYNCTHHEHLEGHPDLSGNWYRLPRLQTCQIALQNLPSVPLHWAAYSLNEKRCLHEELVEGSGQLSLPESDDDYLVLVVGDE